MQNRYTAPWKGESVVPKNSILIISLLLFCSQLQSEGVPEGRDPAAARSAANLLDEYVNPPGQTGLPDPVPVRQIDPLNGDIRTAPLLTHLAQDDVEAVVRQIQAGVDVNVDLGSGATPLMYAESAGMTNALLELGADVNRKTLDGTSVLHHAVSADKAEAILPLLLAAGANVDAVTNRGETPLLMTRYLFIERDDFRKAASIVRMLYRAGASVDARDLDGYTMLMSAVVNNRPRLVQFMLALGSDSGVKSMEGKTALDYARALGYGDIAKMILNSPY